MKFVDEAVIDVEAGKGGDGCLSFARERNRPRGGPDGGDGGDGGSVRLIGDANLNTLIDFRATPRHRGQAGQPGRGRGMTGAAGATLNVGVPVGTTVVDEETRAAIGDVAAAGQAVLVARGGARGLGNLRFKSSTNRAPRQTTLGKPGERRRLRLELKVLADVGLLGLPNAGKSTLLARVSSAKPRVADYPFTTLTPNLGVVRVDANESFVLADIPGVIEGASRGAGLGHRFLKHLSRAPLLLHLVDAAPGDGSDPLRNSQAVEAELRAYSPALAEREIWMVATKGDLPGAEAAAGMLKEHYLGRPCHAVSAVTGAGVRGLVLAAMAHVAARRRQLREDAEFAAAEHAAERRIGTDILARAFDPDRPTHRKANFNAPGTAAPPLAGAPPATAKARGK